MISAFHPAAPPFTQPQNLKTQILSSNFFSFEFFMVRAQAGEVKTSLFPYLQLHLLAVCATSCFTVHCSSQHCSVCAVSTSCAITFASCNSLTVMHSAVTSQSGVLGLSRANSHPDLPGYWQEDSDAILLAVCTQLLQSSWS